MEAYKVFTLPWYRQDEKYGKFLDNTKDKKVLLLELGVGFNTPGIIRLPFEQMVYNNDKWNLVRINKDNTSTFLDKEDKIIKIKDDISAVFSQKIHN